MFSNKVNFCDVVVYALLIASFSGCGRDASSENSSDQKLKAVVAERCGSCDSIFGIPFGTPYDWTACENVAQYSFSVITNGESYTHVSFKLRKPFCEMSDGLAIFNTQTKHLAYISIEKKVMLSELPRAANNKELFQIARRSLSEKYANGREFKLSAVDEKSGMCWVMGSQCFATVGVPGEEREIILSNFIVEDRVRIGGNRSHLILALVVKDLQEHKASEVKKKLDEKNKVKDEASVL